MDAVANWFATLDWAAIVQIIIVDILLGGDNAVVIALASRNLPHKQRNLAVFWGAGGAIMLRVILIAFAVALLRVPLLKLVGGALLLWIGVKLIAPAPDDDQHADIQASDKLWAAIKTIIVADFVMSLDNVVAIAGVAEQADPGHQLGLVVFGLLVSVPFIVFGSQIILRLLDRFPIIIILGGGLLGWIAGGLMIGDPIVKSHVPGEPWVEYAASTAGAIAVIVVAKWLERQRQASRPAAG
jgi:YjbE family integral membrane protein